MEYNEFLNKLLPELKNISSFNGRYNLLKDNLQSVGSGTGRAVFAIDEKHVIKLAKNNKGIAQNEVEARIGQDYYPEDIVTKVFEADENDYWLIAEKAKKVTIRRIRELTGIQNLADLVDNLHKQFTRDSDYIEVPEYMRDNEFAIEIADFVGGYEQEFGDLRRASSYGEVIRHGEPTIVLTDYGLNDEVYNTHYNPQRRQYNQIYELYNCADGNDDILSDIGGTEEARFGMWAMSPYDGLHNSLFEADENIIKFINKNNKYPEDLRESLPNLIDLYHECVNNFGDYLNVVESKELFVNNLMTLQEFLIKKNTLDRDLVEVVDMNNLNETSYFKRELGDRLSNEIAKNIGLKVTKYLGGGNFGYAYETNDGRVLKITADATEAIESHKLKGVKSDRLAEVYAVYKIKSKSEAIPSVYAVILEKLQTQASYFRSTIERIRDIFLHALDINYGLDDIIEIIATNAQSDYNIDFNGINEYLRNNKIFGKFINDLVDIKRELLQHNINSNDYINPDNLGYKNQRLAFFDVGYSETTDIPNLSSMSVSEDGSSKFTSDDSIANDGFPTYSHYDSSPVTDNNVPCNINDDLEYSRTSDATQDKFVIDEHVQYYSMDDDFDEDGLDYEDISKQAYDLAQGSNINILSNKELSGFVVEDDMVIGAIFTELDQNSKEFSFDIIVDPNHQNKGFGKELVKFGIGMYEDYKNMYDDDDLKLVLDVVNPTMRKLLKQHFNFNDIKRIAPDRYEMSIDERVKSFMSNSTEVSVKKKCRLAGNGNTSDACNQGDINNLDLKKISEGDEEDIHELMNSLPYEVFSDIKNKKKIVFNTIEPLQYQRALSEFVKYGEFMRFPSRIVDKWKDLMIHNVVLLGTLNAINGHDSSFPYDEFQDVFNYTETEQTDQYDLFTGDLSEVTPDGEFSVWMKKRYEETNNKDYVGDGDWSTITEFLENVYDIDKYTPNFSNGHEIISDYGLQPLRELLYELVEQDEPEEIIVTINKMLDITHPRSDLAELFIKGGSSSLDKISNGGLIGEDIGDKYLQNKYHMKPEFDDFNKKYDQMKAKKEDEVVYNEDGFVILKNPKTLKHVPDRARGVIDRRGNLYVNIGNEDLLHERFVHILEDLHILEKGTDDWHKKINNKFLTVQRYWKNNIFLIGESMVLLSDTGIDTDMSYFDVTTEEELHKLRDGMQRVAEDIMERASRVNPNIRFEPVYFHDADARNLEESTEMINEEEIMKLNELPFKDEIKSMGGKIYSVGGAVRDEFLGKKSKDLDILITGIPFEELENLLTKYGKVDAVGKSFGIIKFKPKGSSEDIDVAIPRTEKMTGDGHKGFDVVSDHELPIEDDLYRRDFTINAIAKDIDGNIIDSYNGVDDLKNKVIRIVNPKAFSEDPLRILRGIQFASRFNFTIDEETMKLMKSNIHRLNEITSERILIELDKIVKKGNIKYGAELLNSTLALNTIFDSGRKANIAGKPFDLVKTMGEFIYLLGSEVVDNPVDYFRRNFKGSVEQTKMLRAIEMAFDNAGADKIRARAIAFNMYKVSPESLMSRIIPTEIQNACKELLSGKYPKTLGELQIDGNDLMQAGYKGKDVGDKFKKVLLKVYSDSVSNSKEDLLSLLDMNEGVGDKYLKNRYGMPDKDDDLDNAMKRKKALDAEKPVAYIENTPIFKNPKSLDKFEEDVRAISDREGNLYVAQSDGYFFHRNMGDAIGLTNSPSTGIKVYDRKDDFMMLHRIGNTDKFGLADSSTVGADLYKLRVLKDAVNKVNPQFEFILSYYQYALNENEEMKRKVLYSAIVLDETSRKKLIDVVKDQIPKGYQIIAHHMTINLGEINPNLKDDIGKEVELSVNDYGLDDKVFAAGVSGYHTRNAKPHITIAVNRKGGGKPYMSNNLKQWQPLIFPFTVKGIVTEVVANEGETLNNTLNESKKKSKYKETQDSINRSKSLSKEMKEKILKYVNSGSSYKEGGFVHGLRKPKIKGKNFLGNGFGADKNGFYVYTHRTRSKSHPEPEGITDKEIKFIESTG